MGGTRRRVEATGASTLRHAADGHRLLASDPSITRLVAVGLAERLNFVTTYLADLTHQYGDAPGLAMVSEVLSQTRRARRPARDARIGARPRPGLLTNGCAAQRRQNTDRAGAALAARSTVSIPSIDTHVAVRWPRSISIRVGTEPI